LFTVLSPTGASATCAWCGGPPAFAVVKTYCSGDGDGKHSIPALGKRLLWYVFVNTTQLVLVSQLVCRPLTRLYDHYSPPFLASKNCANFVTRHHASGAYPCPQPLTGTWRALSLGLACFASQAFVRTLVLVPELLKLDVSSWPPIRRVLMVLDVSVTAPIFVAAANEPQTVIVVDRDLLGSADAIRRGNNHGRAPTVRDLAELRHREA